MNPIFRYLKTRAYHRATEELAAAEAQYAFWRIQYDHETGGVPASVTHRCGSLLGKIAKLKVRIPRLASELGHPTPPCAR
jgi:hypothetical protein